jgi:hypothetical protein
VWASRACSSRPSTRGAGRAYSHIGMRSSKDDPPERAARGPDSGNAAPGVRASDAERERTTELLRDAAAEGRLSFEELAGRIDSAAQAVTRAELERLTIDLRRCRPSPASRWRSR